MKKLVLLYFSFALLLFTSCKKSTPNNTTSTPSSTASGTPNAYLVVEKDYNYFLNGSLASRKNSASATFYYFGSQQSYFSANNVTVNGINLPYNPNSLMHSADSIPISTNLVPNTWQVTGNSSISSFNFTNNDSFPVYTGLSALPDTINKNQNTYVTISGISGANEISVVIYDCYMSTYSSEKRISTGVTANNTFTFSPTDLSPVSPSSPSKPGMIFITINKNNNQQVSGNVNVTATNQLQIIKGVYIK
ncbi:MAG: hypothetical protein ACXVPN_12910 [Bacteroidia bacterium]